MKQIIFVIGELTIVCDIISQMCTIYKNAIPIYCDNKDALIKLLLEVHN